MSDLLDQPAFRREFQTTEQVIETLESWASPTVMTFDNHKAYNMAEALKNNSFQKRVGVWVQKCFGNLVRYNREERSQRFLEEALELVQANGLSKEGALALVEYTYGRPVGVVEQELGGVMVTLAALCDACELDMVKEGEVELARIMDPAIMAKIQAKQATKPANSSLPGRTPL